MVFALLLPFLLAPDPVRPAWSFIAETRRGASADRIAWQAPEAFSVRNLRGDPELGRQLQVERAGTRLMGEAPGSRSRGDSGVVEQRVFAARPDGYSLAEQEFGETTSFVLGQARAGKLRLVPSRVGGRGALRATVRLYQNDCAALRAGTARLWLDRETLLPLRIETARRNFHEDLRVEYRSVNARVPATAFAHPRLGARPQRIDYGFVRASPSAAKAHLSYDPQLPRSLPAGFRPAVTGWARTSGITGAEGSNPRFTELFAAVYRHGFERIDVTQRLARGGGWPNDPFGAECQFQFEERAKIGGVTATFGTGPFTTPHLFWRSGRVLYTVSGPFPKRELVAIAESLARV